MSSLNIPDDKSPCIFLCDFSRSKKPWSYFAKEIYSRRIFFLPDIPRAGTLEHYIPIKRRSL